MEKDVLYKYEEDVEDSVKAEKVIRMMLVPACGT
jgi:hypothetical protein